jgi:hypothetical protein
MPLLLPAVVSAQEEGFDGYVQSGTCAAPTTHLRVQLQGRGAHDVEPYLAQQAGGGGTVVLGYYGAPEVPGFGVSAIYGGQAFSLVVTGADTGTPVACGDILQPTTDRFGEAGVAVVQLLPVAESTVQGVAVFRRTQLERELDVTPTTVSVLLSEGTEVSAGTQAAGGYNGYIQGGSCASPTNRLRVQLQSRGAVDVSPYLAQASGSGQAVTVAYYGAPLVPGFGLAAVYTDQPFSLAVTGAGGTSVVACGDLLKPDSEDFTRAGLALVQLQPVGDEGAQGYAVIDRLPMQRELDVTPTRVRMVIFAPPAG